MDGPNNVDAVHFFYREVLPKVKQAVPDARLVIVGRNPAPALQALSAGDGTVVVTGTVPDIRPYLRQAAVFVSALRVGVGVKNHILEAMAAGCAIVATSISAEGIDARDGVHLLVRDRAEDIAGAVVSVLQDRVLAHRLGTAAGELVRERYSWESMAQAVAQLYQQIAGT
jgi:glycosyltransferase involved in cell wall biosynthesis